MVLAAQGGAIALVVRDLVDVLREEGVLRIEVHPHARGLRPASGQHRRAARDAGGNRAISATEIHAIRRKAIERRRGIELVARSLRSEEHTSELQSLMRISYAFFRLKKKKHDIRTYSLHI